MRLLLIALVAGGCSSDGGGGGTCSYVEACTGGQVCDFTAPEGPVCVDPDDDSDGDGIPAIHDYCQHQVGGASDEDLDYVGDACDRCPIAAPPATPDADGDEVDSPCDPEPTQPGEVIALFEGFNDGALPSGWTSTGEVTVEGGVAKLVATGATPATITTPLPSLSSNTALLASWRADATDPQASESGASVFGLDRRPAGVTMIACGASRTGTTDRVLLDTGIGGAQDNVDQLFDPAALYRAALKLEGATAQCALIGDHDTGAVQAATNGEAMTEAGLAAKGATIGFSYLLVVQRP